MQAAFLCAKLTVRDEWNARRREIADWYSRLLAGAGIDLPLIPEYAETVWHLYVIRSQTTGCIKAHLEEQGVSMFSRMHLADCSKAGRECVGFANVLFA